MNKFKKGIIGALAVLLLAAFVIAPAAASFKEGGYPLVTVKNGTIVGDVYVSSGNISGLQYTTSYQPNTLSVEYEIPDFDTANDVEWARLYYGVWGGTNEKTGYTNASLGATQYSNYLIDKDDPDPPVEVKGVGKGLWGVYYDVTNEVKTHLDGGTITAVINTWNTTDADGIRFDRRIYGSTLVIVYSDSSEKKTEYWINDGVENLNYYLDTRKYGNETNFFGPLYYADDEAEIALGYYAGNAGDPDLAYFSVPYAADSPTNYDNISWDRPKYLDYQFDHIDVANATNEIGDYASYFDLKLFTSTNTTELKDKLKLVGSKNYVIYRNGYDLNVNGTLDCAWGTNPKEGESYYSPFLAVLKVKDIYRLYAFSDETPGIAGTDLKAYESEEFDGTFNEVDAVDEEFGSYSGIKKEDASDYETEGDDAYAAHRFEFEINEANPQKLEGKWVGEGSGATNGARMYIWNRCNSTYEQVDSKTSSGEFTLTFAISSPSCYVDSNFVNLLVVTDSSVNAILSTDYVELCVFP